MTDTTRPLPESPPTRHKLTVATQAATAADQRIAALRSQLAMVQAERSLLHTRTATPSSPPPARSEHGPGGWIFAGLSFAFFLSMIVFAATRPPAVRIVEVEVTREVRVPVEVAPVAVATPTDAPAIPEPEAGRPRPRPRPNTNTNAATTMMGPRIDFDRCGGDPLCGS